MENNVVLTGRMDQVNRLAPGEEEIVDYKTGKPQTEDKAKKDMQLSAYALAAREVFDWNPARLTLYFLQNESGRERDARRQEAQQSALGNSGSGRGHPRRASFPRSPASGAESCDFESICPAREQGAAASASGEE